MRARGWAGARLLARWAALPLMLLCWALSLGAAAGVGDLGDGVQLRLDGAPVAWERAKEILEAEERAGRPAPAFWRQRDGVTVESLGFGRSAQVSVIFLLGDASLALPGGQALGEGGVCLLDGDTAFRLFGSTSPVGCEVTIGDDGSACTVAGLLPGPGATLLVRARQGREASFDRLTLAADGAEAAGELVQRYGLTAAHVIDSRGYQKWAGMFPRLAVWAMGLALLGAMLRLWGSQREYPLRRALLLPACGAALALWLWAAEFRFQLPQSLLPTRWSDFDFWARLAGDWKDGAYKYLVMKKEQPDVLRLGLTAQAAAFGLGALLCQRGTRRLRVTPKSLPLAWALCLAGSLAGALAAHRMGWTAGGRALWLAVPMYLWLRCILRRGRFALRGVPPVGEPPEQPAE